MKKSLVGFPERFAEEARQAQESPLPLNVMRSILLILLGTLAAQGQAQTVWTLERCLQQALEQNIDLQTTALNVTSAKWQWEQARHAQLPSFSLSAGQFLQSGRSIDRFTNQFVQSSISSNNFQAQGSWTLFAGQQIQAQKAGAELRYQAAGENQKSAEQALALNVATSYLQCLQALARFKASESQTANSQATLNRAQLQFDAQLINESELSNAKAQHQSNVARQTGAWNSYLSALQALQQFIRKPYDPDFRIDEGGLGLPSEQQGNTQPILPYSLQDLLNNAQERPDWKAAQYNVFAAEQALRAAKGATLPTLSMGASTGTVYSDNAKEITGINFGDFQPIGRVQGSGEIVEAPELLYSTQTIAFGDQLSNNLGNTVGVNLSIPLYNNRQNYVRIQQAELDVTRAQLNLEKTQQSIENELQTAWLQYNNAASQFQAAALSENAQLQSIRLQRMRFEQGLISQIDMWVNESNYNNAVQAKIEAQFEFQFRRLILDFYANPNTLITLTNE